MSALMTQEEARAEWEEFQAAVRACPELDEFYVIWNERATVLIKLHALELTVTKLTQQRRRLTEELRRIAQTVPAEFKKHLA
jgi:hypothetical protein